jgi:hypothetical protein
MSGYVLTIERRFGFTELYQRRVTDADSKQEAVDNFHDYYSMFWGDETEEVDALDSREPRGYLRPDGAESVELESAVQVTEDKYEVLSSELPEV